MRRFARAEVKTPQLNLAAWSSKPGARQASSHQFTDYPSSDYLYTHATIVASLDTEAPVDVALGLVRSDGQLINRIFPDYRVTPSTEKYGNNNGDGFERRLLLQAYKTFIGCNNYQEHVQVASLAKGKVLDAVPRDVGDSVYIDLLIATHRKNASLIAGILSGAVSKLSMGCLTKFTICSKCGNVSVNDTAACSCILNHKGKLYEDTDGCRRRVIELCGHHTVPDSVTFNDASWVDTPAFTGAVVNAVLDEPSENRNDSLIWL